MDLLMANSVYCHFTQTSQYLKVFIDSNQLTVKDLLMANSVYCHFTVPQGIQSLNNQSVQKCIFKCVRSDKFNILYSKYKF